MDPRLISIAATFAKNDQLVPATLAGVSDQHYRAIVLPGTNPMAWILGHLTGSRHGIDRLLGGDEEYPYGDRFRRGAAVGDPATTPAAADLLASWRAIGESISARCARADATLLGRPWPGPTPSFDGTVLGTLGFLALHECYHLGQLGFLRKALGYPGMAG
ncbi:MAG TPA: DinB family protein [Candidatus Krumholzibacteria bacterium]|nr:DinB family protein [Candidatus Krumholzibacteria bacterium]HPD73090.1 DinB family protein [Candidatus Krumholzibacteria bacterium]HRY41890.1 DinB family protein [Candidatus Krumholzibacteria bacterium]